MSLQHAAKHLEKHGRNGDTMLVHMSKGEVKSLNDLAMAHGGHLTVNPHTGLPEAGFLQRMLPMAIGAGLMMVPGMQPMAAAALVGGGYAASTGSLKQGLMAGLGAYGGAGMAGSFGAAGAPTVAPDLASAAITTPAAAVTPAAALPAEVVASDAAAAAPAATTLSTVPANAALLPPAISNTPFTSPGLTPPFAPAPAITPAAPAPALVSPAPVPAPVAEASVAEAPVETSKYFQGAGGDEINAAYGTPSMDFNNMTASQRFEAMKSGTSFDNLIKFAKENPMQAYSSVASVLMPEEKEKKKPDSDPGQQYTYEANATTPTPTPTYDASGREKKYFNQRYVPRAAAGGMMASGGITGSGNLNLDIPLDLGGGSGGSSASGGTYPFQNNGGFAGNNNAPQASQQARDQFNADQAQRMQPYQTSPTPGLGAPQGNFFSGVKAEPQDKSNLFEFQQNANPMQQGTSQIAGLGSVMRMAGGGMASGGISDAAYNLGGYSDGGRLLRGPGDGVSDSIPAVIGKKQPARLADGEFVVPARIVSELGNGSTEAGARKLYAMMDRIQKARGSTVGKGKVAKNTRADKYLPA